MVGGQLDQAIAVTQRALELAEDIGMSLIDQAAMQADLGFFFLLAGRPGEAEAPLRGAIFAKKSSSGRVSFTHDLNVLAMLMIALERPDESVAAARAAVEQAVREQHADVTPYALHGLAMALLASDQAAAAYDAAVEAMSNLVPAVHDDLRPLLDLTLFRVEAQLGGEGRGLSETLDRLEEILDEEQASTSYAGVLLLELVLEANLADRGANLLDALTEQALEGHVAAMIRRITQRMASSPSAPAKAPMASEQECLRLEALAERVLASISKLERHA
jgi:tetratricopeptide (TPR) repeat protein